MTKDRERECYLFGTNLALLCIYSTDNNEKFYKSLKSLDDNLISRILRQYVFFRSSFVASMLFSKIKDKKQCNMVADYFFSKLSDELKINSVALASNEAREYAETVHNLGENYPEIIYHILVKAGIKPGQISQECFNSFVNFQNDDLQNFWFGTSGIQNMFKLFNERSRKNSGCLGSLLILILVICFLVYVI